MDFKKFKILKALPKALSVFWLGSKKQNEKNQEQKELDKELVFSLSKSRTPSWRQLKYLYGFLDKKEKILMLAACFLVMMGLFGSIWNFYDKHTAAGPTVGGKYSEGLIGQPRYINPLYNLANGVDNDLSSLIYSSLFRTDESGQITPDLVESYEVSPDSKNYIIKIKSGVKWHNGSDLTTDDIVFTFNTIKTPEFRSPWRAVFNGVEIEKIDENILKFSLAEPYGDLPSLLTFGIIPQDLWGDISPANIGLADINLKPIGSGPYKFKSLVKDKSGNIRSYKMEINSDYYNNRPFIEVLVFKFFGDYEEAIKSLNENEIDGLAFLPLESSSNIISKNSLNFYNLPSSQINAIFFNSDNNKSLSDKNVRQALALSINKNEIISRALAGHGQPIDGPLFPQSFNYRDDVKKYKFNISEAKNVLSAAGWRELEITEADINKAKEDASSKDKTIKKEANEKLKLGTGRWWAKNGEKIKINLTVVNTDENIKVAELVKNNWNQLGVSVDISLVSLDQINNEIIRPRNFEALLYGEVLGLDNDLYPFWHSSRSGADGFNLPNFSNKEADKLLSEIRVNSVSSEKKEKLGKIQSLLAEEVPAIFVYSPQYLYVQNKMIKNFLPAVIYSSNNRFDSLSHWYIDTDNKFIW